MFKRGDPQAREAGHRGGLQNREHHDPEYFAAIGLQGGLETSKRGREYYSQISRSRKPPITDEMLDFAQALRDEGASWRVVVHRFRAQYFFICKERLQAALERRREGA